MLRQEFLVFLTALTFFTRIPCSGKIPFSHGYLAKSSRYFPIIGWIIGAAGALIVWLANLLFPVSLAVLLSIVVTVLLTGALHEDGFIDVCDAFGGGWTKEQILTIMKDSRIGAFGAIGIILLLGLKFLSLTALPFVLLPAALIAGHSLSRFASVSLMYTHDYVRDDVSGKSKHIAHHMSRKDLFVAGCFGSVPLILLGWDWGLWIPLICLFSVGLTRWYLGRYFKRRIGGYTGDCLGAAQQITEVVFYLTLVSMC